MESLEMKFAERQERPESEALVKSSGVKDQVLETKATSLLHLLKDSFQDVSVQCFAQTPCGEIVHPVTQQPKEGGHSNSLDDSRINLHHLRCYQNYFPRHRHPHGFRNLQDCHGCLLKRKVKVGTADYHGCVLVGLSCQPADTIQLVPNKKVLKQDQIQLIYHICIYFSAQQSFKTLYAKWNWKCKDKQMNCHSNMTTSKCHRQLDRRV